MERGADTTWLGADYFEIGMLLGACFLVNWVTSDAKTNMSEGLTMITFYAMIVRPPCIFVLFPVVDPCMYVGNGGVVVPRPAAGLVHAELPGLGRGGGGGCGERELSLRC